MPRITPKRRSPRHRIFGSTPWPRTGKEPAQERVSLAKDVWSAELYSREGTAVGVVDVRAVSHGDALRKLKRRTLSREWVGIRFEVIGCAPADWRWN